MSTDDELKKFEYDIDPPLRIEMMLTALLMKTPGAMETYEEMIQDAYESWLADEGAPK